MQIHWRKAEGNLWCKLNSVDTTHAHFDDLEGVYVVWHGGDLPATVCVGHGWIRERILAYRMDPVVQQFKDHLLMVTWGTVEPADREGVARYLHDQLEPIVDQPPDADPIPVNLPW